MFATFSAQMRQKAGLVTAPPGSVLVYQMLLEPRATNVRKTTGKLRAVKAARPVIVMLLVPEVLSAIW